MRRMLFFLTLLAIVTAATVAGYYLVKREEAKKVTSFEECVEAGNPVQESYPPRCSVGGQTFTQDIGNTIEKQNLIRLSTPTPNQKVTSPLKLEGEARGGWYFEANFPVKIVDANGKVLGTAVAQAQGDWMSDNFVPFSAEMTFEDSSTESGKLILEKENPSGLAENDDSLEIPVKF